MGRHYAVSDMDVGLTTNGLVMQHHLNAAKGWLDLGNYAEADRELEQITPAQRAHPDVLEMRWEIYAKRHMWTAAIEMALAVTELAPDRYSGWMYKAFCLHALGRTQQAYDSLVEVADRFADVPGIPYSLACYACQLSRPDDGFDWLRTAMECGDAKVILKAALAEITLEPIWNRLRKTTSKRQPPVYLAAQSGKGHARFRVNLLRGRRRSRRK
jgi:hypothetical protein